MSCLEPYHILAFYLYQRLSDPHTEVVEMKKFCQENEILGRIYLSEQGINGQLSAKLEHAQKYKDWLHARVPFQDVVFKTHYYHEHAFPKLTVKYRKQLVALDFQPNLELRGEYLAPKEWCEKLESQEKKIILDVRNNYESKVGHFEGAEIPPCDTFREFKNYADSLKQKIDPKTTPVMMYCTGGIRCEIFSAFLKEEGFDKIYQLEGGVIQYGLDVGSKHWLGKLFVFDDRLTVPISPEETRVIGKCYHCGAPTESYYNCANMDCNTLFLCCSDCLKPFSGCCKKECQEAPRIRPFHHLNPHKPFRKGYNYPRNGSSR